MLRSSRPDGIDHLRIQAFPRDDQFLTLARMFGGNVGRLADIIP